MRQAVIIAGGSGTRLVNSGVLTPKLLLPVSEKRLVDFLMLELELENFTHALFILGVGSSEITDYLSTLNSNVDISYVIEKEQKGTFGALTQNSSLLAEKFLVIYGDLLVSNTNLGGIFSSFQDSGLNAAVLCKYTDHSFDSDLLEIDEQSLVVKVHPYPHQNLDFIPPISLAGVFFFSKSLVTDCVDMSLVDISKNFLNFILESNEIRAYFHQGVVRDIGTTQRLTDSTSLVQSFGNPITNDNAILLDRDGVINRDYGYVVSLENVTLTSFAPSLLALIKDQQWKFGIVTNQPAISRNLITKSDAVSLTQSILSMVDESYSQFEYIYICPHHPDSGFSEEIKDLKIKCSCRKPAPGLLLDCLNQLKVRANRALLIGDRLSDIEAAVRIGAKALHVHQDERFVACKIQTGVKCTPPDLVVEHVKAWSLSDSF
jgi:mannose-1-phosphate guanylyltransferase/phosphomannomutase